MRDYDEYEDYGRGGFEKFSNRKSGKKKYKGHQSRHNNKTIMPEWDDSYNDFYNHLNNNVHYTKNNQTNNPVSNPVVNPVVKNNTPPVPQKHEHVFGPNTHTIKGVQIDLDGVVNIEQINRPKDGKTTYGIKFVFAGYKQSFRIIWFNENELSRDRTFASEKMAWLNLQKNKKENVNGK